MPKLRLARQFGALRIAVIYAIIGGLWITFSDRVLGALFHDALEITHIQTLKGLGYVILTAILLYSLIERGSRSFEKLEATAHAEQAHLKAILENTTDAIWAVDRTYTITAINSTFQSLFLQTIGRRLEIGSNIMEAVLPEMRPFWQNAYDRAFQGEQFTLEQEHHLANATHRFEVRLNPIRTLNGDITGVSIFVRDITERDQTLTALQRSEAQHRAISETISDFAYALQVNPDGMVERQWLTGAYQSITGFSPEEVDLSQPWFNIIHPEDREQAQGSLQLALTGESDMREMRILSKDHQTRWLRFHIHPVWDSAHERVVQIIGAAKDVTQERTAQEALRESENKYRTLFEASTDAIFLETLDGKILDCNAAACAMYGCTKEKLCGLSVANLVPEEIATLLPEVITKELLQGGIFVEALGKRLNGEIFPTEVSTRLIQLDDEPRVLVYVRDITTRKQAEEELRESEARLRQIIEQMPYPVEICTPEGVATIVNQAFLDMFKIPSADLIVGHYNVFEDPVTMQLLDLRDSINRVYNGEAVFIPRLELPHSAVPEEYQAERTGNTLHEVTMFPVFRESGEVWRVVTIWKDITAREQAQEELRQIFAMSPDMICVADINTAAFTRINPAFTRVLGYTEEELLQQTFLEFVHPDDIPNTVAVLRDKLRVGERVINFENRYRCRDGSYRWFSWVSYPVPEKGLAYAIAHDVTERIQSEQALRESEARYRLLFDTMMNGFALHDILTDEAGQPYDYRFLEINPAFEKLTGLSAADLLGKTVREALPDLNPLWIESYDKVALTGEPAHFESYAQSLGRYYEVSAFSPREKQFAVVFADITERKHAEQILEEERALLARRVEEHTADLRAANLALAQASRAKDEFLASMSHELRTPLNAILGMTEALQELVYGPLNVEQQHSLHNIQESGQDLLALINDILDLSKIEAGKLELDIGPVVLETVCQASLRTVRQASLAKRLRLSYSADETIGIVQIDGRRLKQILVNLLSNAIKFTPEGGTVGLDVRGDEEIHRLYFTVWDSGIGIAPEDMERIFEPFVQVDSRLAKRYGGTGLGLALVYKMTQLHNGEITVESRPGEGSRFTIALPWQLPPTQTLEILTDLTPPPLRPVRQDGEPAGQTAPQLLIVEDNAATLEILQDYLCKHGYRVNSAGDGLAAIAQALDKHPDLLIMDMRIPRLDGFETLRRLRALSDFSATPIIALTALAMPGDRERCLEAGADAYLSKPVSLRRLIQTIQDLLKAHW